MKFLLLEPYAAERLAKKWLFNTIEEALSHISECMVNERVIAWVCENDGKVSHSHVWEIADCTQEGDLWYCCHANEDEVGLEIEGEKIAFFGHFEVYVTNTFGNSDYATVTLCNAVRNKIIESRIIPINKNE